MTKQITKSIVVKGEIKDLYEAWLDFGNHPNFIENITSVTKKSPDINTWVMEGPLDTRFEWTTRTTRGEPNKRIAWKTIEGDLKTSGQVTFTDLPQGQAEITVTTQTIPPNDLIEKVAISLFEDEDGQLEKDLRNFKAFVENRDEKSGI
jgi:uncharacterized membrane protein